MIFDHSIVISALFTKLSVMQNKIFFCQNPTHGNRIPVEILFVLSPLFIYPLFLINYVRINKMDFKHDFSKDKEFHCIKNYCSGHASCFFWLVDMHGWRVKIASSVGFSCWSRNHTLNGK